MKGDVFVEVLEKSDPLANQDRRDRIINLIGEAETEAFTRNCTAPNKPDVTEPGSKTLVHELGQITCIELDGITSPRQLTSRQDEGRFITIRPPQAIGFETKRPTGVSRPTGSTYVLFTYS